MQSGRGVAATPDCRRLAGSSCRAPGCTQRVGHVAAMQHLVQRDHQEAATESCELPFPSFGRRLGRPVEILLAERIQKFEISLPQFHILLAPE